MKKKVFLSVVFLFLIFLVTVIIFRDYREKEQARVCFKEQCFDVEVAITPAERELGLMFRESLEENEGMLFIFEEEDQYSFWMKNTLIPLDIIWINAEGKVVFISENNQPCREGFPCPSIKPTEKAKYVLEVNAGVVEKTGLVIGDTVDIKYLRQ